MFQVGSKSSAMYGVDTGFAVSKIGLHTLNCRFNAHPSAVVCSHLFVSIHLQGLMITNHIFTFYTPFLHVQLQLWPGRASHNSARAATQTAKSSPKFFRKSFCRSSCFHWLEETRKKESVCNRWRQAVERESKSCVETHQRRKKPDLLSPQKKSTADVCSQILPLPPITETHAKICSASEFSSLCTHLQTCRLT